MDYDDKTLEKLSNSKKREFFNIAPWICWESESSSYGKCLRRWAFYPRALPIFSCSAHGAHTSSYIDKNEIDDRAEMYFDWNKKRVQQRIDIYKKKKSYTIIHPWIYYRKKYIGSPLKNRTGLLYFFPHSNKNIELSNDTLDKLIKSLKLLGKKYGGVTICLSCHDIEKDIHKKLRKYSIPLVTAGNTSCHKFVDRFYKLIYSFKYTCGSAIGSHVYYSIEAGVPHFIIKSKFKYKMVKSNKIYTYNQIMKIKNHKDDLKKLKKFEDSLKLQNKKITNYQKNFVLNRMGYYDSISRLRFSLYLWRELLLNSYKLIYLYPIFYIKILYKFTVCNLKKNI